MTTDPAPTPPPDPVQRRTITPEERALRAAAARLRRQARAAVATAPAAPPPAAAAQPPAAAPQPPAAAAAPPTPGQVVRAAGIRRPAKSTAVYVSSGRKRQVLIPARKRIITHTISTPTSSRPQ